MELFLFQLRLLVGDFNWKNRILEQEQQQFLITWSTGEPVGFNTHRFVSATAGIVKAGSPAIQPEVWNNL